jgi:hypothetical protein
MVTEPFMSVTIGQDNRQSSSKSWLCLFLVLDYMFSELQPSSELIVYVVCYRELNPDVFMSLHGEGRRVRICNERVQILHFLIKKGVKVYSETLYMNGSEYRMGRRLVWWPLGLPLQSLPPLITNGYLFDSARQVISLMSAQTSI